MSFRLWQGINAYIFRHNVLNSTFGAVKNCCTVLIYSDIKLNNINFVLSSDIPANAGLLRDKPVTIRDKIKGTFCEINHSSHETIYRFCMYFVMYVRGTWLMTNVTHKFLSMYLFLFLTLYMFRPYRAHHQERQIVWIHPLVTVILCWWPRCVQVGRILPTCTRQGHQHRVTVARGCIDKICLSWWWARYPRNM